jgi:CheY-like chemotaxis protein
VEVQVRALGALESPEEQELEITVRDDGPGIGADFLPHVFSRFRQADSGSARRHGGLGLGLAIVRHLVELHGGRVAARNRTDAPGAEFVVTLPRRRQAAVAAAVASAPQAEVSLSGVRVLVVDDEADARSLASALLERSGARAVSAGSVDEALKAVELERPDVVLADIAMPVEDGYELLRRLRERPAEGSRPLPVAALTAYASAEDRRRLLQAGFQAHLTKPLRAGDLALTVLALARPHPRDLSGGT